MPRVLVSIAVHPLTVARLRALAGVSVEEIGPHEGGWDVPASMLPGPDLILCKRPPRNLDAVTDLKVIQIGTVGYEHLKPHNFAERPVRLCNARGLFDTAIAEWNVGMMFALARDLRGMLRNQDHGVWDRPTRFGAELRGKVVGTWGYGGIGRETARLAKTLGMAVHVLARDGVKPRGDTFCLPNVGDPGGKLPDHVFTAGQERDFLGGLDFLIVAMPLTQRSTGLIGEMEFRAMPRTSFLLNPSRGPIVKEEALLSALRLGWIAGAALDTHFAYPLPADHPLWRFPNVILTPHVSGIDRSEAFPARMGELFVQNVERYLLGRPLLNEVTREEWLEA
jgi:phosphoglycerate dehydrogenase-like enzyme